jgi:hypothetical protein
LKFCFVWIDPMQKVVPKEFKPKTLI